MKIHRAWLVCIGCAMIFFCTMGLTANAFSIYTPYILKFNGFTNTQVSSLMTARTFTAFIAMIGTAFYYKHLSLKNGMLGAGLLVALAYFTYGIATSYPVYLLGSLFAGLAFGLGSMVPIGMILNKWFKDRISMATGMCACSSGLSTLGIPNLITILISKFGLGTTFIMEAVFIVVVSVIGYMIIASSPEETGDTQYEIPNEKKKKSSNIRKTREYKPVLHGKAYLVMIPLSIFLGCIASVAYCHLTIFMTSEGLSTSFAATVIMLSGLAVTFSKFMYGTSSEHIGVPGSNLIFGSFTIIGLIICILMRNSSLIMGASIVLYSAGLGMFTVGPVLWARELSYNEDFEKNNRLLQVGYSAGGLIFSTIPGMMADIFNGSYIPSYFMFSVIALISLFMIQSMYHFAKNKYVVSIKKHPGYQK